MGYTHYYYRTRNLDKAAYAAWVEDCKKILSGCGVDICGWDGTGKPTLSATKVAFNGDANCDNDHETFSLVQDIEPGGFEQPDPNGLLFSFCKTAMKPYDRAVTACLIAAKARFGDAIQVSSDGDAEDWKDGLALFQRVLPDLPVLDGPWFEHPEE